MAPVKNGNKCNDSSKLYGHDQRLRTTSRQLLMTDDERQLAEDYKQPIIRLTKLRMTVEDEQSATNRWFAGRYVLSAYGVIEGTNVMKKSLTWSIMEDKCCNSMIRLVSLWALFLVLVRRHVQWQRGCATPQRVIVWNATKWRLSDVDTTPPDASNE